MIDFMKMLNSRHLILNLLIVLILKSDINLVKSLESGPVITTKLGDILGTYQTSAKYGRQFSAFLGIPFAEPPLGDLRFKAPIASSPWTGILNATEDTPMCFQFEPYYDKVYIGQEDCLTLNVYAHALDSNASLLPVMVFTHGGSFIAGEDTFYEFGPQKHMDYDILLVLMNYRLGPLGFLSTYDGAAPGNFGLMDQVLALKWVQDNIAAFGGNPNDVTLVGQSAGSASVTLQMLSPVSSGLFHRVIAESGTALTPWGMIDNPIFYTEKLANLTNCSNSNSYEMVDCLRQIDIEDLYNEGLRISASELILAFVPVVENPDEDHLFLWEDPLQLLTEGRFNKVPLISGFNKDEGCLPYMVAEPLGIFRSIDDFYFDVNVPLLLRTLTDYRQNLVNISYAIKDLYYSKINLTDDAEVTRTNIDLLSDMYMIPWVFKFNNMVAMAGVPVYTYAFNYQGNFSFTYFTGQADDVHAVELVYLFNLTFGKNIVLNEKDSNFGTQLLELWTNFTIFGNPTPVGSPYIWQPTPINSTEHLSLDEELIMLPEYQTERMYFWLFTAPSIAYATV